jgi:hypothetical protein
VCGGEGFGEREREEEEGQGNEKKVQKIPNLD